MNRENKMNSKQKRILIIEDNKDLTRIVAMHLEDLNMRVDKTYNGKDGYLLALQNHYDLILLDIMMPGMNGIDVCRELRSKEVFTPILMLTAKSSEVDRVLGLEVGADDYLSKPFSLRELVARVNAVIRRNATYKQKETRDVKPLDNIIRCGDLTVNVEKRAVSLGEDNVDLTATEFDLLMFFIRQPGLVFSRSQLLDKVWGYGHEGYEHTVNSHINRLRAKIEKDAANPSYILTVWGVGYKFTENFTENISVAAV